MPQPDKILTHDLESHCEPVQIRKIAHKNPYDFQKLHRHNYFEIIFFHEGGGENLIDLQNYEVKSNACYIIYPGQTHLLNRSPNSAGVLIQFQLESITSKNLQRLMQERAWSGVGAVVFENDSLAMARFMKLIEDLKMISETKSAFWKESQQHLLQAILFELSAFGKSKEALKPLEADFYLFQQLVDLHFKQNHSVGFYIDKMSISEKRLASLSKTHMGTSPLQVIHRRILLEAKRLLVIGDKAHKEIAFELGFDSPASFSAFIKKKTGLTASEIQMEVSEIHKR